MPTPIESGDPADLTQAVADAAADDLATEHPREGSGRDSETARELAARSHESRRGKKK